MIEVPPVRHRRLRSASPRAAAALALLAAAASLVALSAPAARAQRYVATADTSFPRVRYADSLESVNDRCIVRMTKLSRSMRPVYVNGWPIGFC
jgi:hypothetical protein